MTASLDAADQPVGDAAGGSVKGPLTLPVLEAFEKRRQEEEQKRFEKERGERLTELHGMLHEASREQDHDGRAKSYLTIQAQIQQMWREKPDARIEKLNTLVQKGLLSIPPPATFQHPSGLDMILTDAGGAPLYISAAPISRLQFHRFLRDLGKLGAAVAQGREQAPTGPDVAGAATGVTWDQATAFTQWLTDTDTHVYRLPELHEIQRVRAAVGIALWTASAWDDPDPRKRDVGRRFGIQMVAVWDGAQVLGPEERFGELPHASHPRLGFVVVTEVQAGLAQRLRRLGAAP